LELYNAINETGHRDAEAITRIDLDDVFPVLVRNDIAFIFKNRLLIIEHQLSVNANTPLRMGIFFSRVCVDLLGFDPLTTGKEIPSGFKIPNPEFVVLYCGGEDYPAEGILKLSDLVAGNKNKKNSDNGNVFINVRVLNINRGCNPELERRSKTLASYAAFIAKFRENLVQVPIIEAIEPDIDDDILMEYSVQDNSELIDMMMREVKAEVKY